VRWNRTCPHTRALHNARTAHARTPPPSPSLGGAQDAGGAPFTEAEVKERFDELSAMGVRAVGIWRSPIPDNWWPFLRSLQL